MFCKYCGKENESGNSFCVYCGKKIEEKTIPPNIQQPFQTAQPENKPKGQKWLWVVIGVCVVAVVGVIIGLISIGLLSSDTKKNKKEAPDVTDQAEATSEPTSEPTAEPIATPESTVEPTESAGDSNSDSIFPENNDINMQPETQDEKVVTNLIHTGMYHNGREINRVDFNAKASSTLKASGYNYNVKNLWDLNTNTSWVEGKSGDGIGEKVTYSSKQKQAVSGIAILPGYLKREDLFYKNGMPTKISVKVNDEVWEINCSNIDPYFDYYDLENMLYYDFGKVLITDKCTVTIEQVRKGTNYSDTCITEMFLYYQE